RPARRGPAPPPRAASRPAFASVRSGREATRMRAARQADPFTLLGLPARAGLSDDEVRAAWRRIAAATHPDRADGGDAARFAAAAAAYTALRTNFGRAEALADLARPAGSGRRRAGPGRWLSAAGRARRRLRPAADGGGRRWRPAGGVPAQRGGGPGGVCGRGGGGPGGGGPPRPGLGGGPPPGGKEAGGGAWAGGGGPPPPPLIPGILPGRARPARHDLAPPG